MIRSAGAGCREGWTLVGRVKRAIYYDATPFGGELLGQLELELLAKRSRRSLEMPLLNTVWVGGGGVRA